MRRHGITSQLLIYGRLERKLGETSLGFRVLSAGWGFEPWLKVKDVGLLSCFVVWSRVHTSDMKDRDLHLSPKTEHLQRSDQSIHCWGPLHNPRPLNPKSSRPLQNPSKAGS